MSILYNIIYMWRPLVEIAILWFVIYHILLFFEGTRAIQVLRGIIILLVVFFLFQQLGLTELSWLLTKLFGISVIAVLIIFQPEIRQGLARLGQRNLFGTALREEELDYMLKEVSEAADSLCKDKFGALIVIENKDPLKVYIDSGIDIDALVSNEAIQAIFTPNNLLHDGGLVIRHGRIAAAGCLFPLTQSQSLSRMFGTRHRAALGLSEETDAIIIVISEERQDISLVYRGRLFKDLSKEEMFSKVKDLMQTKKEDA
ncbi:MAG: diadenylate cyclase CdaA [Candidatus Omnitrophota bacterium]